MRGSAVLSLLAACLASVGPALADEIQDRVSRYVSVLKKDAKNDAALAAKLLAVAAAQKDNPQLGAALCREAYARGIREPSGYATAISAAEALMEKVPAEKDRWRKMLVNVYRLRYTRSRRAGKDKAGTEFAELLVSLGDAYPQEGSANQAAELLQQAQRLLMGRRSALLTEVTDKLRDAQHVMKIRARVQTLTARLAKSPSDNSARTALIRLYVTELDQPQEAQKLLLPDTDELYRNYGPLGARKLTDLKPEACLELARWYTGLVEGSGVSTSGKIRSLGRAIECYERFLVLHQKIDVSHLGAISPPCASRPLGGTPSRSILRAFSGRTHTLFCSSMPQH